jgi:hypothetical protein
MIRLEICIAHASLSSADFLPMHTLEGDWSIGALYTPPPPSLVEKYTMTSDVCAESLIQIKILHQKGKEGRLPQVNLLILFFNL